MAVVARVPRGRGSLAAQLDDASASVVLNLAEAMGRWGADRARTLRISRGSLLEVDAALGALERRRGCDAETRARCHGLAVRLAAMLTGLAAAAERAGA
ncbi:MAG: four helix bundle protein [Planctomycetales bacterium]|nr:four helix bundle protein [Planctomycetales bacterium]